MNILIPTVAGDQHSICVHWALKQLKHHSILWDTADFPIRQSHSFHITANQETWHIKSEDHYIEPRQVDVIWLRRPCFSVIEGKIAKEDRENVLMENQSFFQSWWDLFSPQVYWVNAIAGKRRTRNKLLQLRMAKQLGWNIPDTLFSNNPEEIKAFIKKKKNRVIYKTLTPMKWQENDHLCVNYTRPIEADNLPSDSIIQGIVGIYQEMIRKAYELRVTCMGENIIAVKILSQEHPQGKMDWRAIPPGELCLEPHTLPNSIQQLCLQFMKAMGVVFGCFDLIYSEAGEYYFLECNEQGQFLWIEEICPSIRLLDPFVRFLTNTPRKDHEEIIKLSNAPATN